MIKKIIGRSAAILFWAASVILLVVVQMGPIDGMNERTQAIWDRSVKWGSAMWGWK